MERTALKNQTHQRKEEPMENRIFMSAAEVANELGVSKALLGVSKALAYKMIRQWNGELQARGFTTIGGRVSRRYFLEKIYGAEERG